MKTRLAILLFVVAVGVVAANQLGAQQIPSTGTSISAGIATVQNIVEITRAVPAGTASVDAFTVPAGVVLVVTDIVVTNTGTAAACGAAVTRAGGAATPTPAASTGTTTGTSTTITMPSRLTSPITLTQPGPAISPTGTNRTAASAAASASTAATTSAGTLTQSDSTVTGPLCVPAQSTTTLPLTTGIEFSSGQVVQLLNAPPAAGGAGSLAFHLRGLLIAQT